MDGGLYMCGWWVYGLRGYDGIDPSVITPGNIEKFVC
jgi:hypothetical protein